MEIVAKVDELGKGAWIGLLVVTFIVFWPLGLALLFFLIWSGRMGHGCGMNRWHERMHARMQARRQHRHGAGHWHHCGSSGNVAFDEYRDETLKRLEEEQQEFREFLDRLRHAKDRAEFEQFMAERRRRPDFDASKRPGSAEPHDAEPSA